MKARLLSILIRLVASSWRIRLSSELPLEGCVVAFWHGDMLPVWKCFSFNRAAGVTSLSKDGDLLAQLLRDWGFVVLRGSSSSGAKEVLASMTEEAKVRPVLVTPDGPRGPAHVFKPGAAVAAHRAGVDILVIDVKCRMGFRLKKNWDSFLLPVPFAKISLSISKRFHWSPESLWIDNVIRGCSEGTATTAKDQEVNTNP